MTTLAQPPEISAKTLPYRGFRNPEGELVWTFSNYMIGEATVLFDLVFLPASRQFTGAGWARSDAVKQWGNARNLDPQEVERLRAMLPPDQVARATRAAISAIGKTENADA